LKYFAVAAVYVRKMMMARWNARIAGRYLFLRTNKSDFKFWSPKKMTERITECENCGSVAVVTERAPDRGETFAICKDCNFEHGPFTYAGAEEEEFEKD
jgi:hypothetical protein